jgi:hypothetical protein
MTTPKEKAEKLVNKFAIYLRANLMFDEEADEDAKVCALIAVDELIKFGNEQGIREPMMYWHKVKEELEKL